MFPRRSWNPWPRARNPVSEASTTELQGLLRRARGRPSEKSGSSPEGQGPRGPRAGAAPLSANMAPSLARRRGNPTAQSPEAAAGAGSPQAALPAGRLGARGAGPAGRPAGPACVTSGRGAVSAGGMAGGGVVGVPRGWSRRRGWAPPGRRARPPPSSPRAVVVLLLLWGPTVSQNAEND